MSAPAEATGRGTVSGMAWTAGGFGVQAVAQFAVLALLARFLTPVEFGLVTAGLLVIGLVRIVTDALVGPAVTQLPQLSDDHVRSAFTLSVAIGGAGAVALWVSAEAVVGLFAMPQLGPVVRGLAPVLLVDAVSTVPIALLQRDLAFRRLAVVEAISFLVGYAAVGGVLAVGGAGVWALVWAQLAYTALRSALVVRARPHARSLGLDPTAAGQVLRYGSGHTLGRLFNYAALQGDYFVVGRWLSASGLGVYGRAYQLAVKPAMYLGQALDKVLFPVMASIQGDRARLAEAYRRTVSVAASVSAPASVLGVVLGPELVRVVLGPGWEAVVVPFQILAAGLLPRTGYKPSDSLARASGRVYARAWRQAVYACCVVGGALLGARWGLPGVAGFVVMAIVVNYLLMAQLSLSVVGLRWTTFAAAHLHGLALAGLTLAVSAPVAMLLRANDAGSALVLAGSLAAVGSLAMLALRLGSDRLLGHDLTWLRDHLGALLHRGSRRQGRIIAVIGADGSGKSTLTGELATSLRSGDRVERLYLGSGDGPAAWYRAPLRLARNHLAPPKKSKPAGSRAAEHERRGRGLVHAARAVWAVTLAMEKVGKTRRADRWRRRGIIVICDRYPQTSFPGGNDGPLLDGHASRWPLMRALARWESRTYARAAAVLPDLVLKLDVPLDTALARRPGLDPAYLAARVTLIRALDLGAPTVVLNAALPYEQVRQGAVDAIAGEGPLHAVR